MIMQLAETGRMGAAVKKWQPEIHPERHKERTWRLHDGFA
jgi:hypothetical protein